MNTTPDAAAFNLKEGGGSIDILGNDTDRNGVPVDPSKVKVRLYGFGSVQNGPAVGNGFWNDNTNLYDFGPSGTVGEGAEFWYNVEDLTTGIRSPDEKIFVAVGPLDDCDGNGLYDYNEIFGSGAPDCNSNGVLDVCEAFGNDGPTGICKPESICATQLVNPASTPGDTPSGNSLEPSVSSDGRFVAFESDASNLVEGDGNGFRDIFVFDRLTEKVQRVNVGPGGVEANLPSFSASVSKDGRFVAFVSFATNLVPGGTNGQGDVFVHDRVLGETELVSVALDGGLADDISLSPVISADGLRIAFVSEASNLVASGTSGGERNIFMRDRTGPGSTTLVSAATNGQQGDDWSRDPDISDSGSHVAFASDASDLVANDQNGSRDAFLWEAASGTIERVSVDSNGVEANSGSSEPKVSANGERVVFGSDATNLSPDDWDFAGDGDIFLRDLGLQSTTLLGAIPATSGIYEYPEITADGVCAAYVSDDQLSTTPMDGEDFRDAHIEQIGAAKVTMASLSYSNSVSNQDVDSISISAQGRSLAFDTEATNLIEQQFGTAGLRNVFVRHCRPARVARFDGLASGWDGWFEVVDTGIGSPLDLSSEITLEAWVRMQPLDFQRTVVAKWGDWGINDRSYSLAIAPNGDNGTVVFSLALNGNQNNQNGTHDFSAGFVPKDEWVHIACTYDGAERRIYVNGILAGSLASSGTIDEGFTNLGIGAQNRRNDSSPGAGDGVVGSYFNGDVDQVRVWAVARSAWQVQSTMNRTITPWNVVDHPGLIGAWNFDDAGTSALEPASSLMGTARPTSPQADHKVDGLVDPVVVDCDENLVDDWMQVEVFPFLDQGNDGVIDTWCEATVYCTAGATSLPGCVPQWSTLGVPSASAGSGFTLTYGSAPGGLPGLMIYTTQGPAATPVSNPFGFLCINTSGLIRTPILLSGGTTGTCSGAYSMDFNQYYAAQVLDPTLVPGAQVDLQAWFRDPGTPGTAVLSEAIQFPMCP